MIILAKQKQDEDSPKQDKDSPKKFVVTNDLIDVNLQIFIFRMISGMFLVEILFFA